MQTPRSGGQRTTWVSSLTFYLVWDRYRVVLWEFSFLHLSPCCRSPTFRWGLGIWTRVFRLAQQVLFYQLSHLPRPCLPWYFSTWFARLEIIIIRWRTILTEWDYLTQKTGFDNVLTTPLLFCISHTQQNKTWRVRQWQTIQKKRLQPGICSSKRSW